MVDACAQAGLAILITQEPRCQLRFPAWTTQNDETDADALRMVSFACMPSLYPGRTDGNWFPRTIPSASAFPEIGAGRPPQGAPTERTRVAEYSCL